MPKAVIGIGSNINPSTNTQKSLRYLQKLGTLERISRWQTTQPIDVPQQADFINGTVLLETKLTLQQLETALKAIEHHMGRPQLHDKNAPRTIDLDIVVYDNDIIDSNVFSRDYLKEATAEVYPELIVQRF